MVPACAFSRKREARRARAKNLARCVWGIPHPCRTRPRPHPRLLSSFARESLCEGSMRVEAKIREDEQGARATRTHVSPGRLRRPFGQDSSSLRFRAPRTMSSSQGTRLAGLALGRALNRGPILVAGSSAVLAATATPPTATFNTVGGSVVCPPCHMRTLSSKAESTDVIPTTGAPGKSGAAFPNDLRSTCERPGSELDPAWI